MTAGVLKPLIPVVKGGQLVGYARPRYTNSLAFTTVKTVTVPAGAKYVIMTGTLNFYVNFVDAASVPGDVTDGSASILIGGGQRTCFALDGVEVLTCVCASATIATFEFFK